MGPTTFREQLRTIFGVRLTRAELGALVSDFDLHRNGMVDAKEFAYRYCTVFLHPYHSTCGHKDETSKKGYDTFVRRNCRIATKKHFGFNIALWSPIWQTNTLQIAFPKFVG